MAATRTRSADSGPTDAGESVPTAAEVASRGLRTTRDYARFGGSLINDVLGDRVATRQVNPICRVANFVLRGVDLENRHNDGKPLPTV